MKTTSPSSKKNLTVTILSLSLLTVMAGAAVAPALDVIKNYFSGENQLLIQMIISVPALFIVITNMFFVKLCKKFRSKTLLMAGLVLYTAGGCVAGVFSNIYLVLAARALVGIGVGIVMPMSTGLLAFYYTRDKQEALMGYSSAMNQMGGVIATLLSGLFASISWRASFLVYLMGLISIVLCILFLPNEYIGSENTHGEKGVFKKNYPFVIAMFLLMFTFFIYPADFAMETAKEGIIGQKYIAVIMASMDLVAFAGGLAFVHMKKGMGKKIKFAAPILFLAGYLMLNFVSSPVGTIAGSWLIGFANGEGVPFIISAASKNAGRSAATTVMPLISAALYLAQFMTPIILLIVSAALGGANISHLPYCIAIISAILFFFWSYTIKED